MAFPRFQLILFASATLAATGCAKDDATAPDPGDTEAPLIIWFLGPEKPVSVRAAIPLHFRVEDHVGTTRGTVRVNGAFDLAFEFEFPDLGRPQREWILNFYAPDRVDIEQLEIGRAHV